MPCVTGLIGWRAGDTLVLMLRGNTDNQQFSSHLDVEIEQVWEQMTMRKRWLEIILGVVAFGSASAGQFSVGINGVGLLPYSGTGLNLYKATNRGVELVKGSPFIFNFEAFTGVTLSPNEPRYEPTSAFVGDDNDVAYVVYESLGYPYLVKFAIKPTGLVPQWAQKIYTGSNDLDGSALSSAGEYVLEKTYPYNLFVWILNAQGQFILDEASEGSGVLNSSYIKHHFHYSCRTTPYIWPDAQQVATSVAIYDLEQVSYTGTPYDAQPMLTSSDAEYVQSVCGTAQH
jgi:hypothetical protein